MYYHCLVYGAKIYDRQNLNNYRTLALATFSCKESNLVRSPLDFYTAIVILLRTNMGGIW